MNSLIRAGVVAVALAGISYGQRGGMGGGGFRGGMGGGGFRGGMGGGARIGGMGGFGGARVGGFGGRGFVGGRGGFGRGVWGRPGFGHFGNRQFGHPWGFPLFWPVGFGGFGAYSDFYGGYPAGPNVTVVYPQSPYSEQSSTPVVINNNSYVPPEPARPNIVYPPQPEPEPSDEPPIYLVAFKDGTIRTVVAYWITGTTLHYVTTERTPKSTPLDQIDRALSERLNRERRVPFRLPG